jgi:hypothetical protein
MRYSRNIMIGLFANCLYLSPSFSTDPSADALYDKSSKQRVSANANVADPAFINQMPPEIMQVIFKAMKDKGIRQKNLMPVCKLWPPLLKDIYPIVTDVGLGWGR